MLTNEENEYKSVHIQHKPNCTENNVKIEKKKRED
jgi:hypothetical protein